MRTSLVLDLTNKEEGIMSQEGISVEKAKQLSSDEKEKLLRKIEQDARDAEVNYWGCGRVVLSALQQNLNLGGREVVKAASPCSGGIGRMREACGALVGGVMAIGLAYAKGEFEAGKVALEQAEEVESLVRASKFGERFRQEFGHLRCLEVQQAVRGADYVGYHRYNTIEAFTDHAKCGDVTGRAARMAAEIILEPTELYTTEISGFLDDLSQVRKQQKSLE